MPYSIQSIDYLYKRLTLSGLDPSIIALCKETGFNAYFEWWSYDSLDALEAKHGKQEVLDLINEFNQFHDIGEFISSKTSKEEFSAYMLVILDRFAISASKNFNYVVGFSLIHQIYECISYISPPKEGIRNNARNAANVRHAGNRAKKDRAFSWYQKNGSLLTNDAAAIEISDMEKVSLRTAQNWVSSFRKIIRSARKT